MKKNVFVGTGKVPVQKLCLLGSEPQTITSLGSEVASLCPRDLKKRRKRKSKGSARSKLFKPKTTLTALPLEAIVLYAKQAAEVAGK